MSGFLNAIHWLGALIRATLRPRPRTKLWEWADRNVIIPDESGGPAPGQLNTGRFAIFRGLHDLAQKPGVHYFALCASARVGKTLFSIVILLYWLAERVGCVVWLDPSTASLKKFVRSELDPFLRQCGVVRALAIISKTTWTVFWKTFRGKVLRIVGSGAEADMHGFNAELAIINELDRCRGATDADASSPDKIIARTRLFPHTRFILENSTPGVAGEFSPIWQKFQRGSQHHCYLPCPHCSAKPLDCDGSPSLSTRGLPSRPARQGSPSQSGGKPPQSKAPPDPWPIGWSELSLDPDLTGWQRLTFASEKKLVPFDADLNPLLDKKGKPADREHWREETTGQIRFEQFAKWGDRTSPHDATKRERYKIGYDVDHVEHGASYQCAHCKKDITFVQLRWMLARYRWVAHNPHAPRDRISAHVWAAYSPFEGWGIIAKEFIEAKSHLEALIKFHNFTLGLPFIRQGAAVKDDDLDRVILRTPVRYVKGQIPMEAEVLTMTIDKQGDSEGAEYWYSIRAWGVLWDHPERPSWSALVDWGSAHSYEELLELAGLRENDAGELRKFTFTRADATVREYFVTSGLVDSGYKPESVYEFCLHQTEIFDPYKGCPPTHTRGSKVRISKVLDEQLDLWLCWSDYFTANLYYDCIKFGIAFGRPVQWWLPTDIDADYRAQLTDEFQGPDGWTTRKKCNHLGDTEKMHRALADPVEATLDAAREERDESEAKSSEKK